jgi:excisionase family DNA binding protein
VEEGFYTVDEAARILRLTPNRIRQMLRGGELEGIPPEESGGRGWKIPMHPVHDRDRPARVECPSAPPESPERLSDLEAEALRGPKMPVRPLTRAYRAYREKA